MYAPVLTPRYFILWNCNLTMSIQVRLSHHSHLTVIAFLSLTLLTGPHPGIEEYTAKPSHILIFPHSLPPSPPVDAISTIGAVFAAAVRPDSLFVIHWSQLYYQNLRSRRSSTCWDRCTEADHTEFHVSEQFHVFHERAIYCFIDAVNTDKFTHYCRIPLAWSSIASICSVCKTETFPKEIYPYMQSEGSYSRASVVGTARYAKMRSKASIRRIGVFV